VQEFYKHLEIAWPVRRLDDFVVPAPTFPKIISVFFQLKMDYIVSGIEASQDGQPYVFVIANSNDYKSDADKTPPNPFGANMMAFTSPEGFNEEFA
jgi:hypothetical protein